MRLSALCLGLQAGKSPRRGSAPVAPEQMPSDHQSLDFAGPFVDLSDAGISVVPLSRHLCHIPHAAQDLDGLGGKTGTKREAPHIHTGERAAVPRGSVLTWWLMAVAASDAASLAMADSYPPQERQSQRLHFQRDPQAQHPP